MGLTPLVASDTRLNGAVVLALAAEASPAADIIAQLLALRALMAEPADGLHEQSNHGKAFNDEIRTFLVIRLPSRPAGLRYDG